MKTKKLLTLIIVLFTVTSALAQDAWTITANQIDANDYYGVTVANGMIGLVSSPEPMKISRVVLGGLYDIYGRGRVNNFIHGIGMLDMELKIDGTTIKLSNITDYSQTLDMYNGMFGGQFNFKSLAHIEYHYTALRQMPYSTLLSVTVVPSKDIVLEAANILTVHESYSNPREYFNTIVNGPETVTLCTSLAQTPTRKREVGACSAFVFDSAEQTPQIIHRATRGVGVHTQEFSINLKAGQPYTFSVVGTTLSEVTHVDVRNEVERMTVYAALLGVDRLTDRHKAQWHELWQSDIIVNGDAQVQQDIHSMIYHMYAFMREDSGLSCSPMGLSGFGYNGHVFWDAETWVFPALLMLQPKLAESMIDYRYNRLDAARHNAFMHGYKGAMFPWESSEKGNEDNTVNNLYGLFENHITADVAIAAWQYFAVSQDVDWLREKGYPIISETADFWVSRADRNDDGSYSINNVIGADEWNKNPEGGKIVNDNAYTNGAAKRNLEIACKAAKLLGLKPDPTWGLVAKNLVFNKMANGVTAEHDTYDGAITKQADVILLAYPLGLITDKKQISLDLEYYLKTIPEKKTPAMSKSIFSILYTILGDRELALHYFNDSYLPNLNPPFRVMAEFNGGTNPYFITGAGGVLQSVLFGFGGLQITDKGITAGNGKLPSTWQSLTLKGIGVEKKTFIIR